MNELDRIAEESGLPKIQSQALLETFLEFFGVAAEWEEKAKKIKVTDESQTEMMLLAREGRKEMQQLRLKLDRTHKEQKKIPLLYGRAVDGMRNVLRFPITQLEEYLQKQEDFVIIKKKAEAKARQEEAERLLQEKEAAEEKAIQEEVEKERREKEKELKEANEKAAIAQKERDEAVAKQKLIDDAAREEREKHQRKIEENQRLAFENEERIRVENEKVLAAEQEKREAEDKEREEKAEKRRTLGQNRQNMLFEINVNLPFESCADMVDEEWNAFYEKRKEEFRIEQDEIERERRRLALEKERAEKESEEEFVQPALRGVKTKCPSCGHIFEPRF